MINEGVGNHPRYGIPLLSIKDGADALYGPELETPDQGKEEREVIDCSGERFPPPRPSVHSSCIFSMQEIGGESVIAEFSVRHEGKTVLVQGYSSHFVLERTKKKCFSTA